ncbi:MAG: hypothetical protein AW07_00191 [Candidatus Accumulibacter sp. SK-11]|nr:MAG: hypothetical protein AW07_00191 [Candidatus Accumulibacter sp. SK-11]
MVFWRMRWKSIGSSPAGRSPYFSASFIIASWTMSSADSSLRTANIACLNARRSTAVRKSDSSRWLARAEILAFSGWKLFQRSVVVVNALTNRGQSFNVADFFRAICFLGRRQ